MSKLAHSNQETMDEIERRSEIEGDYIASIEGPHEDKPPAHPILDLEQLCRDRDEQNRALRAEKEKLREALKQALILIEAEAKIDKTNGVFSPARQWVLDMERNLIPAANHV